MSGVAALWHGEAGGMLSLGVDRVRDPLEQRRVISQGRDMAPVHVLGAGEEVVIAGGVGPRQSRPCAR